MPFWRSDRPREHFLRKPRLAYTATTDHGNAARAVERCLQRLQVAVPANERRQPPGNDAHGKRRGCGRGRQRGRRLHRARRTHDLQLEPVAKARHRTDRPRAEHAPQGCNLRRKIVLIDY